MSIKELLVKELLKQEIKIVEHIGSSNGDVSHHGTIAFSDVEPVVAEKFVILTCLHVLYLCQETNLNESKLMVSIPPNYELSTTLDLTMMFIRC